MYGVKKLCIIYSQFNIKHLDSIWQKTATKGSPHVQDGRWTCCYCMKFK
jgi:hypothetical protein